MYYWTTEAVYCNVIAYGALALLVGRQNGYLVCTRPYPSVSKRLPRKACRRSSLAPSYRGSRLVRRVESELL